MSNYQIIDVPNVPTRASSGGRPSKFPIDALEVGKGFRVTEDEVSAVRSVIRSRTTAKPTLNVITRRITEGEHVGMFLVTRREDKPAPTETTPAA